MSSYVHRFYRRARYGRPVVVVSGLPRSGTSMAMKMLEAGGLTIVSDGLRSADEDNPKGYYEDERVKDLHRMDDKTWLRDARGKAIKIISWLLKELPGDNNYKVLFMRRHLEEVLASQTKMLDRRGEDSETSDERMLDVYKNHLWRVGYLFKHSPHIEALDLDYKAVLESPREYGERIRGFLDFDLDVAGMAAAVDARLYRNRA
ncbi:MAG TPA: sulfotransferase family protein [Thermoanaerobaculia bacterium]|jgi:hypothetical protein